MRHHRANRRRHLTAGLLLLCVAGVALGARVEAQAPPTFKASPEFKAPPTLDGILQGIATYNGGLESEMFWALRDYVYARKDDPAGRAECETKLLAFLKTPATPVAKVAASRFLRVIGSEQAVPALQALLLDERAFDQALYVLRQIPGPAVDKALLQSLPKLKGPSKIAAIGALGARGSRDSVADLVPLVKQPETARAATIALGAIGSPSAAEALVAALPGAAGELKSITASSILRCAEAALAANDAGAALRLYEPLAADGALPIPLRRAAAIGRLSAGGSAAPGMLMGSLRGTDPVQQEAALARLADVIAPDAIGPVAALVPGLPEASQVKLLAALSGYPPERVRPVILEAAKGESPAARLAAFKALERVGDASVVPFLLETAAGTKGPVQIAARATLGALKGKAVDDALLARLAATPAGNAAQELLLAVAERRLYTAKSYAAAAAGSATPGVRTAAHRALRAVGTPSDIPGILDLLVKTEDDAARAEAEQTVVALARKVASQDSRGAMVRSYLATQKDAAARARLIALLPLIGDSNDLPVLRRALADQDAVVYDAAARALAAWPTTAALDDVLGLARDSRNETHRLLAIAGLVRIVRLDRNRHPEAAVADLRQAAAYSWRPEELRLVLGALSQFPCEAALEVARTFLREPSLEAEAKAAVNEITMRMKVGRKMGGTGS